MRELRNQAALNDDLRHVIAENLNAKPPSNDDEGFISEHNRHIQTIDNDIDNNVFDTAEVKFVIYL